MIHYQLQCSQGHGFDGWFKDSAGFERQAKRGLIACPDCADTKVARALMAPAIASRKADAPPAAATAPAAPKPAAVQTGTVQAGAALPDQLRAQLQRLRAEIERHCDYVGADFATEARRIHQGEADPRAIYGETTPEQAEALHEDGIPFTAIPWVKRADG
ncbi:MAG: DUF1178 family protein [Rhodospirillales bacterium]|nr:DUF1178 family protein [Rhodospirillales bacterium]